MPTMQLTKYPRVLYVKQYHKVYILTASWEKIYSVLGRVAKPQSPIRNIFSFQRCRYNVVLPSQNRNSFCIAIQLFLLLKKRANVPNNFGLIWIYTLANHKELPQQPNMQSVSASQRIT